MSGAQTTAAKRCEEHALLTLRDKPVRWRIERVDEVAVPGCVFVNVCVACGALVVEPDDLVQLKRIQKDYRP